MGAPSRRFLVLIPAHNEAASLPSVVRELQAVVPDAELLVVDDGSVDGTWRLAESLGVRWLRLHERVGVGGAVRAGLRYAAKLGYQIVVRVDGDGQHHPEAIDSLVAPILADRADIILGSRFTAVSGRRAGLVRRLLARCLTILTGRSVTDPTSGFCAFGARAVEMLCEHHPTGYAEAELLLFSSWNGLRAEEVPVGIRGRVAGSTTLTPSRRLAASARIALAMLVVPLRAVVRSEPS
jgi:glycosyltransferase involved in cell wall biosynthesis